MDKKGKQFIYGEFLFLFPDMQKLLKSIKIFQSYDYKCNATFLWFTVYLVTYLASNSDVTIRPNFLDNIRYWTC